MKLAIQPPPYFSNFDAIRRWLNNVVQAITRWVDNAGMGFGDGVNNDNIFGTWMSYTSNAVANTEDTINHNLGVIPVGYLVFTQDKAASLYKSGTAWTTTQIFLKCSVASVALLIFVVAPSNKGN